MIAGIITGLGIGLIWLIRLEAKVLYLEKDHGKLSKLSESNNIVFQSKVDKLGNDLGDIKIALARIESRMFFEKEHQ